MTKTWDTTIQECKKQFDEWDAWRVEITRTGHVYTQSDWNRERNKRIAFNERMNKVREAAGNWHCCAIGEKLQIPEPEEENQKSALKYAIRATDPKLIEMGVWFSRAISDHRFEDAAKFKDAIRYRLNPERIAKIKEVYAKELEFKGTFDFDY